MTRKDYIAIAKVLNDSRSELSSEGFNSIVNKFSKMAVLDNPNFDARRFYGACHGNEVTTNA